MAKDANSDCHSSVDDDRGRFLMHARALASVISYAQSQGLSGQALHNLLADNALEDAKIDAFDGYVSMDRFAGLVQDLGRMLDEEAIGLAIADHIVPGSIGVVGKAFVSAAQLGDALRMLVKYMRLYADVSFVSLTQSEHRAEFSWAYSPLIVAKNPLCDRSARLFINTVRQHFGLTIAPLEVHLQRTRPADRAPFRKTLGPNVVFDASTNMIALRAHDLDRDNLAADPDGYQVALALAERMMGERRTPDTISIRAREDIIAHLADQGASIDETARRLGFSPRSLQRRLGELGTTYQKLNDDVRKMLAEELLVQTKLSISEIAYRLGFANQANLTRAVKRWFGVSPRELRKTNLA